MASPLPRSLRLLLALAALVLLALPARAEYRGTYSQGSWSTSGPRGSASGPFGGGDSWSEAVSTGGVGSDDDPVAAYGACEVKGPATAHLVWQGPGDPPPAIVVKESSSAGWSGSPGLAGGSFSDGLGDTAPVVGPRAGGASDVRYTVKTNPGLSLDLDAVDVHASATAAQPTGRTQSYASAHVGYDVEVTNVVLSVDGTTFVAGDLKILIGRGQTGHISAGGYPIDPASYQWTVSGPQLFDHVDWSAGHAYAPFTGAHTDPTVSFYASKDGAETVSCTCDVRRPDTNAKIGTVNAMANVTVERPDYKLTVSPYQGTYTGYVETNNSPTQVTGVTSAMSATGPLALSVVFTYSAVNPDDFDIDAGKVGLCQLVKEVSSYAPSGGESMSTPELDESYPYHGTYVGVDAFPNESPTQHQDDDAPSRDLTGKTSFTLNILYITTEMYRPDGGFDVPLRTGNWSWITSGSQNASTLLWSPPSGGLSTSGSGGADFDLPSATWSAVKHLH